METTPSQFADPSVYLWNISNNGELMRLEGFSAPPVRRAAHCADYATIRQQVVPPTSPTSIAPIETNYRHVDRVCVWSDPEGSLVFLSLGG